MWMKLRFRLRRRLFWLLLSGSRRLLLPLLRLLLLRLLLLRLALWCLMRCLTCPGACLRALQVERVVLGVGCAGLDPPALHLGEGLVPLIQLHQSAVHCRGEDGQKDGVAVVWVAELPRGAPCCPRLIELALEHDAGALQDVRGRCACW